MKTIVLGPPGTGKTTTLLNKVDDYLKQREINKEKEKRRYVYLFPKGWKHKALAFNVNLPGKKFDFKMMLLKLSISPRVVKN